MRYLQVGDFEAALVMDYSELEALYEALTYMLEQLDVEFADEVKNEKFNNVLAKISDLYEEIDRP